MGRISFEMWAKGEGDWGKGATNTNRASMARVGKLVRMKEIHDPY